MTPDLTPGQDQGDRRKAPPVQVQVQQPNAGGLFGTWASIANMSAVGLIMAMMVWSMFTTRADFREWRTQDREDRLNYQQQVQTSFATMTAAITAVQEKGERRDVRFELAIEELRRAVGEQRQANLEILSVLKSIRDKNQPM